MLALNRVDMVVSESREGKRLIKNNRELSRIIEVVKIKETKIYSYIYKKHKDIAPKIAKTLEEMKKDGTFLRIVNKVNASFH